MKRIWGMLSLIALLLLATGLWSLPRALAQGSAGYTKVASVAYATGTVTFTMSTPLTAGATYNAEVTAQNAAGESGPSAVMTAVEPSTGSHTQATVTITAATGGGTPTTLNLYIEQVQVPNPVGATSFVLD